MTKATHRLATRSGREYEVYFNPIVRGWFAGSGSWEIAPEAIYSLTPLPIEPEEVETFDWKEAMRLYADDVAIEYFRVGCWYEFQKSDWGCISFDKDKRYRRKPIAPPAPKVQVTWQNVYENGCTGRAYDSLERCQDNDMYEKSIARLKITVTEGESLPKVEVISCE